MIDGGRPVELYPDFLLADVDRAVEELAAARSARAARGRRRDALLTPAGTCGKLAEISRRTGVHVVAPTGPPPREVLRPRCALERAARRRRRSSALFAADIVEGIDEHDYAGPVVRRTRHRAGVMKVAASRRPHGARARIFRGGRHGPRA